MTLEKMASRRQPAQRRPSVRAVAVSVLLAASMAMSGCSLLSSESPVPDPAPAATNETPVKVDEKAPVEKPAEPVSAAEEMSGKMTASLKKLASTTKSPDREQMMAAMLEAGAVKEKVELSIDITPTGLAVDAVESATLVGKECVIGQVRDGSVAVTVLPVLASGLCFVGDTH